MIVKNREKERDRERGRVSNGEEREWKREKGVLPARSSSMLLVRRNVPKLCFDRFYFFRCCFMRRVFLYSLWCWFFCYVRFLNDGLLKMKGVTQGAYCKDWTMFKNWNCLYSLLLDCINVFSSCSSSLKK